MLSKHFSPDVLEHVARLNHEHKVEEQLAILSFKSGNPKRHERRSIADAVNADHQRPLNRGSPFQEPLAIAAQNAAKRYKQKGVNRNEDGEESIPLMATSAYWMGVITKKSQSNVL